MSWQSWQDFADDDLTDFERAQLQAMQESVRQYEAVQKQLTDLLFWLATRIAPGEVDRRQAKTPFAFAAMTPGKWRHFFEKALKETELSHDLTSAPGNALALATENRELRERLAAVEARIAERRTDQAGSQTVAVGRQEASGEKGSGEQTAARTTHEGGSPDSQKAVIDAKPPAVYRTLFSRQDESRKRELLFLTLVASRGYSVELGLRWALVQRIQAISNPDSGSVRRLILRLEKNKLIDRRPIVLGKYRIMIITLTDLGRNVVKAMGAPLVESEWERLMRLHGGERQQKHAAQVCLFTHYARRGGWATQVCPEVEPPADPDVLIEKDGQRIYVEVEAASGSVERRMKKWRNQRQLQGFTAICAPTENVRRTLVAEAGAGGKSGKATDFEWLRRQGRPERREETDGTSSKQHDMDVKLRESIWAQAW